MQRRNLLYMSVGAAVAEIVKKGSHWKPFGTHSHGEKPSAALPKNAPSAFPSSYDAVSDMRDYAGRGLEGLQNAESYDLFPKIKEAHAYVRDIFAGDRVQLGIEELIAVACIESKMVPTVAVKTDGGPKQSALGVMQITEEDLWDQIAGHILNQSPKDRAGVIEHLIKHGDNHTHFMVTALLYAIDKVQKEKPVGMKVQDVIDYIKKDPELTAHVMNGRLDPHASMVLAGLNLLRYCNAYPEIGMVFGETQFRAVNQLGPTRTLLMARAFSNDPEMPMSKIFGMQSDSSDDPRNYIPRNNHIDPDMALNVFTEIYKNQYRATLRAVADNLSIAEIPQPFHTSKQMGYAPA